MNTIRALVAAAAALVLCLPAAQAQDDDGLKLARSPACSVTNVSGADACGGAFVGDNLSRENRPLVLGELAEMSGIDGWQLVATLWTSSTRTGTLNLLAPIDGAFAIALKAGKNFSLYYFDGVGAPVSSLSYSTIGTGLSGRGVAKPLAYATLYTTNALPVTLTPVPEPQGYSMLLAGLAGIGFVLSRRRMR